MLTIGHHTRKPVSRICSSKKCFLNKVKPNWYRYIFIYLTMLSLFWINPFRFSREITQYIALWHSPLSLDWEHLFLVSVLVFCCYVTDYPRLRVLTQQKCVISEFPWARIPGVGSLDPLLRVCPCWNPRVS